MAANGDRRTYFVPSLLKTAYNACNEAQRAQYNEWKLPHVDMLHCCERLFEILKLSAERGAFDPQGDRHSMLAKVRPLHVASDIFEVAAEHGHYDCLRFASEISDPWLTRFDTATCYLAAGGGHLECLRYAIGIGCRLESRTCAEAAMGGHLDCLKYARENGCPWDRLTLALAMANGHLHCLEYAQEQGCPY